jgi:hypothetical protein
VVTRLTKETAEALTHALGTMRAGEPILVRSERDGSREVIWPPGDER